MESSPNILIHSIGGETMQYIVQKIKEPELRHVLISRPLLVQLIGDKVSIDEWREAAKEFVKLSVTDRHLIDNLLVEIYNKSFENDENRWKLSETDYWASLDGINAFVCSPHIVSLLHHVELIPKHDVGLYYVFAKLCNPSFVREYEIVAFEWLKWLPITYAVVVVATNLELFSEYIKYVKNNIDVIKSLAELTRLSRSTSTRVSLVLAAAYPNLNTYYKIVIDNKRFCSTFRKVLIDAIRSKSIAISQHSTFIKRFAVASISNEFFFGNSPRSLDDNITRRLYDDICELTNGNPLEAIGTHCDLYNSRCGIIECLFEDEKYNYNDADNDNVFKALCLVMAKGNFETFSILYKKSHNITKWIGCLDFAIVGKNLNIILALIGDERVHIDVKYYDIVARRFDLEECLVIFDALSTRIRHDANTIESLYKLDDPVKTLILMAKLGK